MAWAVEARERVSDKTGLDISLYGTALGQPVGTFTWATMVDNRSHLTSATEELLGDDDYLEMVERSGELFDGNGEDCLRMILQMDGVDLDNDPPAMTQGWSAQIAQGQLDHATDWATDMGTYVHELTGAPMVTLSDSYGGFGTLTWFALFDSAQHADEINEKLVADAEWVKRINYAEDLFIPGSGMIWLSRRIA